MPKQAGWLTQYSVRLRINACTAKLDVDDMDGYGPETTIIYNDEIRQFLHIHLQYRKERAMSGLYLNTTVRSADLQS